MALSIIIQFIFPHLPIYTFGSIISICLIHIYVVGSEKEAVVRKLKASLKREKVMDLELGHAKELVYVLEKGTAVVYFGYTSCPWCRNAVPILIDSIKDNDIDTLYYVDIHNVSFGKYKDKIMKMLDPYLKENDEGEKTITVPDVYVIKEGVIVSHHRGTVDSFKNPYNGMSNKQKKELKKIYDDMIGEIK